MPALAALVVAAATATQTLQAQSGTIAGVVLVEGSQRPLADAQVAVQGQLGRGAVTSASGRFRIEGVSGTDVVVNVRMIGYRALTQTVRVGSTNLQFVLSEQALELNQVVVTGTAGGEQKRALGASVDQVNVSDIMAKEAVPSVEALLDGRAAGVSVLPGTGMVGAGAKVRIRGVGTFSLSSDPLIYVDGVRVDNQTGTGISIQAFSSGVVSRLNDFDPEEIESIEVLKGPAAATLYGTEAARGVINIITKKGASGGVKYQFNVSQGANEFQDAAGRIATNYCIQTGQYTCGSQGVGTLIGLNTVRREDALGTPIFRTGPNANYNGNVSGGNGPLRFFASGDFLDNQGADPTNEQRRQSFRTNLTITPSERVNVATNFGYITGRTQLSCEAGCGGLMWDSEYSNPANLPQFCAPSAGVGCTYVQGFNGTPPAADAQQRDWQDLNRITASATISYNPFPWFSNRLAIGTDVNQEDNVEQVPYMTNDTLAYFWGASAKGYRFSNQHQAVYNTYDYSGSAHFNLNTSWISKSSVGVQYYTRTDQFIQGEGDFFPAPGLQTISSAGQKVGLQDGWSANQTLGYYGQEEFSFNDRLYLTGAVRVDNNSAFGSQVHWVTYPKASLSYVASEEPAVKAHLPAFLNTLRLRAAYGGSGQQPAVNTALQTLQPAAGPLGQGILTPYTLGNSNLKPERVLGAEAGFEAGMFQDRFGIDFTYFHDDSRDAILARGVAPGTGFGGQSQYFNAGEITKQGIEMLLKGQIINRKSYGWDMNVNLSTQSAKILRLNGVDTTVDLGSNSHRIGYAPFDFFSYKVLSATGAYNAATNTVAVSQVMCDNGRGQATPCYSASGQIIAPKVFLGHALPTVDASWTNTIRFLNNFRLYGMLDYAGGFKRLDNNIRIRCQIFYTCLQYVEPQNTDPRLLAQYYSAGTLRDFTINDASYVKVREISLSYDAPQRFANRLGASALSLVGSARNLGMWTRYSGLDPESQFVSGASTSVAALGVGVDQAELPQLLTYVFTVRLSY